MICDGLLVQQNYVGDFPFFKVWRWRAAAADVLFLLSNLVDRQDDESFLLFENSLEMFEELTGKLLPLLLLVQHRCRRDRLFTCRSTGRSNYINDICRRA